jgi:hypothetical protein
MTSCSPAPARGGEHIIVIWFCNSLRMEERTQEFFFWFNLFYFICFCLDGPVPSEMESSGNGTKDNLGVSVEN